jgi:hypothetical protein
VVATFVAIVLALFVLDGRPATRRAWPWIVYGVVGLALITTVLVLEKGWPQL